MHPPSFLADAMLGRLARWLRVAGYDTLFYPAKTDAELVAIANAERRILLTRDQHLVTFLRPAQSLLISQNLPLQQLRQVVTDCALPSPAGLFTRCLVCNTPVRPATAEEAQQAPPSIGAHPDNKRFCTGCGRLYWFGSHTERMQATLAHALPEWFESSGMN